MTFCNSFVAGGAVARAHPDSVGLNPGWRKGVALLYTARLWVEGVSVAEIEEVRRGVAEDVRALDQISSDSATYMNEVGILFSFWSWSRLVYNFYHRRLCMNLILKSRSLVLITTN
jgi:hypothetical protein